MSYTDTLAYLYASQPAFHLVGAAAYKPGLDNTLRLMDYLGNPHRRFRSVHIAGTNGKGSTSHLIAAALQASGLRVGLYTSPHLVDFRERIRLNGVPVPEAYVVNFVAKHRAFLEQVRPSFFETTMAMAFAYFAEEQVDVAVVEVGLGGRLDSTNILTPLLSVITNIGFDHTEFLGDTLPRIAAEKAGIIKPDVPCVIGETDPETEPVFLEKAKECHILGEGLETTSCRIWFADCCGYLRRCRERVAPTSELHGIYQEKNLQTAYVALRVLQQYSPIGHAISAAAIGEGFARVCTLTGLRGRWETLSTAPLTICDTGHNSHGLKYVAEQLTALQAQRGTALHIVFGMVSDKDIEVVLRLMPRGQRVGDRWCPVFYYFTEAQTHRAIPAADLAALFSRLNADKSIGLPKHNRSITEALPIHNRYITEALPQDCYTFDDSISEEKAFFPAPQIIPSVSDAIAAARTAMSPEDILFIGGSNYVVGEALKLYPTKIPEI